MLYIPDTIVALATPPSAASVGIIRVSGKQSLQLLKNVFPRKSDFIPNSLVYGPVVDPRNSQVLDYGLVVYMKSPNSFTGEDIVEFQMHGSPLVLERIINLLINLGARLALAGEFSKRAFLNNKIDLSQAEAIADLISSQSEKQAENSLYQMDGYLSRIVKGITLELNNCLAHLETGFDFSDQDLETNDQTQILNLLHSLVERIKELISGFATGQMLYQGAKIALVGKPNVGKSSLMNLLLKEDKSIVHTQSGTTRDILSGLFYIDQIPVTLFDTAGIHETQDSVESIGIQKSRQLLERVDLILFLLDMSRPITAEDTQLWELIRLKKVVIVATKSDLKHLWEATDLKEISGDVTELSTLTQHGIDDLNNSIKSRLVCLHETGSSFFLNNKRHLSKLESARDILSNAISEYEMNRIGDEVLVELMRRAVECLQEITGEVSSETVLDEVFSKFCIGK
jgi:tRNA modification GTPase